MALSCLFTGDRVVTDPFEKYVYVSSRIVEMCALSIRFNTVTCVFYLFHVTHTAVFLSSSPPSILFHSLKARNKIRCKKKENDNPT